MKNTIQKFSIQDCLALIIACCISPSALSEVTLDGSVGTAGAISGPNYQITEEVGQRAGSNLFHSFGQFNLNNTESATFSGSAGIQNVIGRVTGGQASSIDGTLRVTIPDANLYLLNPAGILFGQNAKLDVPGSFHASTADLLKFQDGVQFESGTATPNPILTTALPEAFGFLGENPAGISVTGGNNTTLEVSNGEMISLVGGDITIKDSSLYAPGGQINLASVGSAGDVMVTELGLDTASFERMGNISISQDPLVPFPPIESGGVAANIDVSADTAGKVFIRGGQMVMESAHIASETKNGDAGDITLEVDELKLTQKSQIDSTSIGSGNGGDLNIDANSILVEGASNVGPTFSISSSTTNAGDAGNMIIKSGDLNLLNGALIISTTGDKATGKSGDLRLEADTILFSGNQGGILNVALGEGDTGNISVFSSNRLDVKNGSGIKALTSDKGNTGNLFVKSNEIVLANDEVFFNANADETLALTSISNNVFGVKATGSSGNLTVKSRDLTISNGATINTANLGSGNSGELFVESNEILLTAEIDSGKNSGGILAVLGTNNTGNSGNLTVKSSNLVVQNKSVISAANLGAGSSGNLVVDSSNIILNESGGINNTVGSSGTIGELTVISDSLKILNGAEINASTSGIGNAGNITIRTDYLTVQNNAAVGTASTSSENFGSSGNSGNLTVFANKIEVRENSFLLTSTLTNGSAGNLTLVADDILISDKAAIQSGSLFEGSNFINNPDIGKSGNIDITLNGTLRLENEASINSFALQANAGDITINNGNSVQLRNDSLILTRVGLNQGTGGDVLITTPVVALDNSRIDAQAFKGRGGDIDITGFLFKSPGSVVTALSLEGIDGELNLRPDTNISGSIAELPDTYMNAANQLSERCAARSGINLSSFVVKGNGSLPIGPGDLTPSNFTDYPSVKEPLSPETSNKGHKDYGSIDNKLASVHAGLDHRYSLLPEGSGCSE